MHTGETWRLGRRPALDGLRGVAVLLVVMAHAGVPGMESYGQVGVTVFFVLSGFLITSLLLEERRDTGTVHLGQFYLRRALRLTPALLVLVVIVTVFVTSAGLSGHGAMPALTYTMNIVQASGASYQQGFFGHTWSLAMEEQFYLLWPLALLGVYRLGGVRWVAGFAATGALAVVAWRHLLIGAGASPARIGYGPDSRADALLVGCALAALLVAGARYRAPGWAGFGGLLLVASSGVAMDRFGAVGILVASAGSAVALVVSLDGRGVGHILSVGWLRAVGRCSYGLYLWHYSVMLALTIADPSISWWLRLLVGGPVAGLFTAASWRLVERPALRLRESVNFHDRRARTAARVEPAGVGASV